MSADRTTLHGCRPAALSRALVVGPSTSLPIGNRSRGNRPMPLFLVLLLMPVLAVASPPPVTVLTIEARYARRRPITSRAA